MGRQFALPRSSAALIAALSVSCFALPATAAATTDFVASNVCPGPAPDHDACLGIRLRRVPAGDRVAGAIPASQLVTTRTSDQNGNPYGLSPDDLTQAYGLPATSGQVGTQTLALVDAFGDPTISSDLAVFDAAFGLPAPNLTIVNQEGEATPLPASPSPSDDWTLETALDVETAHGICPYCKLLLVEANDDNSSDLEAAENEAAALGATEISNSFGGSADGSNAFNHPGIVITASAGDDGYLDWDDGGGGPDFPATSPDVVAVGGTTLPYGAAGLETGEQVWNNDSSTCGETNGPCAGATGGGCSTTSAPKWQPYAIGWPATGCGSERGVSDVSADADPNTGAAIYDSALAVDCSSGDCWNMVGGTSLASPIIAATFALAGGSRGVAYPAQTLYEHAGDLHDITSGGNGLCNGLTTCSGQSWQDDCFGSTACNAGVGYDAPSGLGTPDGITAFEESPDVVNAVISPLSATTTATNVTFDASSSTSTSRIAAYSWQFGDGSTSTSASPVHSYNNPGSYDVVLTITDAGGNTATASESITVTGPPTPDFVNAVISPLSATTTATNVTFDASSSTSTSRIVSYSWQFGDGGTSTSASPVHSYSSPGSYDVVLTITDADGTTASTSEWITVTGPPVTASVILPSSVTAPADQLSASIGVSGSAKVGSPITFQAYGSSTNSEQITYMWSFGDGSSANGEQTSHVYSSAGNFETTLIAFDASGSVEATPFWVQVDPAPPPARPAAVRQSTLRIAGQLSISQTLITLPRELVCATGPAACRAVLTAHVLVKGHQLAVSAATTYSVAAGHLRALALRLNHTGAALLHKDHRLTIYVRVVYGSSGTPTSTAAETVTIAAHK